MKVLGIGNALVDVLAKINNDQLLVTLELPKGAMTLIDETKFQKLSAKLNELENSIVSGGSASNTIVGLASLGAKTGFVGRVGNDKFGQIYKEDLEKYKVTPHLLQVDETSGVASTFITSDGERTFGTYLGAAAKLSAKDLDKDIFAEYDYLYIEGYLVQNHELIKRALELAKEVGLIVAIDLASYNVVEDNRDFLTSVIPQYVDIIFANEEEAKAMTGLEPEEAVTEIAKMADLVIVKAGKNGSWIEKGDVKIHIPANEVNCVDTTGAGDLYAAGFLYALGNKMPLEVCAQTGTLLAGEVIQNIGPKILDNRWNEIREEVEKL